jgi:S-formylglutathione hydrolase FrmB
MPLTTIFSPFGSRVVVPRFTSQALQGNFLGDPAERDLYVYLPPGYAQTEQRYPVLYLLPPVMANGAMEMNELPWQENIQQRMDRLIAEDRLPPLLVVMPDTKTRYGGSQYRNSSGSGPYQDYLLEIIAHVDENYLTQADRSARAFAGKSSGGYGALTLAMEKPELFSMVADLSGDKAFELCYQLDFPAFLRASAKIPDLALAIRDPRQLQRQVPASLWYQIMNTVAMASCYSPNPTGSLGFDLPMDLHTCELIDPVWQRWLAHDPVNLLKMPRCQEALRSMKLLYFDCGLQDEFNLQFGCRIMSKRLHALRIKHVYEEYEGGHRQTQYFRYDHAFAAIGQALRQDDQVPRRAARW